MFLISAHRRQNEMDAGFRLGILSKEGTWKIGKETGGYN
jgi:hypothetical protein